MTRISWPTAVVVCVAIAAVVTTALVGPSVGLDSDTIRLLLGAQGAIGALVAGLMRQLLSREPPRRAEPIWAPARPQEPPSEPPEGGALVVLLVALAGTSWLAGCSSGPQLPIVTTPITITCSWHAAPDGGTITDSDCMIDRSSSAPATSTTGVRTETRDISPAVSVPVGTSGAGSP